MQKLLLLVLAGWMLFAPRVGRADEDRGWRYLIENDSANQVRERYGMFRRPIGPAPAFGPGGRPMPIPPKGGLPQPK